MLSANVFSLTLQEHPAPWVKPYTDSSAPGIPFHPTDSKDATALCSLLVLLPTTLFWDLFLPTIGFETEMSFIVNVVHSKPHLSKGMVYDRVKETQKLRLMIMNRGQASLLTGLT
jgi:hypothetical protein